MDRYRFGVSVEKVSSGSSSVTALEWNSAIFLFLISSYLKRDMKGGKVCT